MRKIATERKSNVVLCRHEHITAEIILRLPAHIGDVSIYIHAINHIVLGPPCQAD